MGPGLHEELASRLATVPKGEVRATYIQTGFFDGRRMRIYSVEMRLRGRPFFVEIFDAVLDGRSPSILLPYVELRRRWGLEARGPNPNAVAALGLRFRQSKSISRLNAIRLNRFMKEDRSQIGIKAVKPLHSRMASERPC